MGLCLGRSVRCGAGDLEGAEDAQPCRVGSLPQQAAHLHDRAGEQAGAGWLGAVDARQFPELVRDRLAEDLRGHVRPEVSDWEPGVAQRQHSRRTRTVGRRVPARVDSIQTAPGQQEGDTPSFLYLCERGARDERPRKAGPGELGRSIRPQRDPSRNHWFDGPGATSVSKWLPEMQADFARRADWMNP